MQKFLKTVSFGLYDPAKSAPPARRTQPERSSERAPSPAKKRERSGERPPRSKKPASNEPLVIEPETPRLYVGNLDYGIDESDLETLFAEVGTVVSASVVRRGGTDRSKGFGFVVMASVEEAKAAKARFHDHDLQGRPLLVSGAKSDGPEGGSDGERGSDSPPRRSRRESASSSDEDGSSEGSSTAEDDRPRRDGRGERGSRDRGGRGDDRRRSGGGGRPSRFDDAEDRGSRNVTPRDMEVVTTPTVRISNLVAEAGSDSFTALFEGIGQVQASESLAESGQVQVTFAEVAEAQRAVELLHRKTFMGETLEVRGVGDTVEVTNDA